MKSYLVAYDLHEDGQNYECITEKLKTYGTHWHAQRSVWIITTDQSAATIRDNLKGCVDDNDKLLVLGLSGEGAWTGNPQNVTEWLQKNL
ncbi:CRISPR associated protein Cas2 [Hoeflea sp. IMCC20628]|uniref:hypothetical protein n=1 Tax=Hoeflea sp. IMCC20628 TaxID=1620421 RepID=UPI00063B0841|nr:hypothetical protein [Hoeflea sp. IMCC20628]AKI01225.1 CRISPR associated protein Cas2 [Hoeflea sp. IMCC20628]